MCSALTFIFGSLYKVAEELLSRVDCLLIRVPQRNFVGDLFSFLRGNSQGGQVRYHVEALSVVIQFLARNFKIFSVFFLFRLKFSEGAS